MKVTVVSMFQSTLLHEERHTGWRLTQKLSNSFNPRSYMRSDQTKCSGPWWCKSFNPRSYMRSDSKNVHKHSTSGINSIIFRKNCCEIGIDLLLTFSSKQLFRQFSTKFEVRKRRDFHGSFAFAPCLSASQDQWPFHVVGAFRAYMLDLGLVLLAEIVEAQAIGVLIDQCFQIIL